LSCRRKFKFYLRYSINRDSINQNKTYIKLGKALYMFTSDGNILYIKYNSIHYDTNVISFFDENLICSHVKLKGRNTESYVENRVSRWKRKEAKRYRWKSTCLKKARCSLLANLVARPACHCTVIHFRSWCIVQSKSTKLLVLFLPVWCAGRRYVRVT